MKIPDKIYLQIEETKYDNKDVHGEDEITWCEHRINKTDIVYYRHNNIKKEN